MRVPSPLSLLNPSISSKPGNRSSTKCRGSPSTRASFRSTRNREYRGSSEESRQEYLGSSATAAPCSALTKQFSLRWSSSINFSSQLWRFNSDHEFPKPHCWRQIISSQQLSKILKNIILLYFVYDFYQGINKK